MAITSLLYLKPKAAWFNNKTIGSDIKWPRVKSGLFLATIYSSTK